MIGPGTAAAIVLATVSQSTGVKWVPLQPAEPAKSQPKQSPPQATESLAPAAPAVAEEPTAASVQTASPQAVAAPSVQGPLSITCFGAGTADKKKVVSGFGSSHVSGIAGSTIFSGSGSASSTVIVPHDRDFTDQVDVRLFGGDDRIRLPRTMLPPLRGGKEGWFKLKNVVADARSIRASAAVNIINNPKVFIDRVTGTISISGKAGDYSGQCEVIDTTKPKF